MRKAAIFWAWFALAAALGFVYGSRSDAQLAAVQDVAVIVNPKNPVDSLTRTELMKIYRGERQYWRTNTPIVLLFRSPGTHEREVVLRAVFQMTEPEYKQYWLSKVMRAEATSPPTEVFSSGMTKEGVAGIPGSIGIVSASDIRLGMRVVRIDGHLPGEAGYPLH
ncbi:MAG TPA: substrate-binding domain-containing protein [Terriglobales bacterium]|jgi:phosphate transport system substrate-binding protein|nr:substrate-binding domain-containing protein [Terriglobales bacterium]